MLADSGVVLHPDTILVDDAQGLHTAVRQEFPGAPCFVPYLPGLLFDVP
jgi:hypothetical protein